MEFHQNVEEGVRTRSVEVQEKDYIDFRMRFGAALILALEKPFRKPRFMSKEEEKQEIEQRAEWRNHMEIVLPPSLTVRKEKGCGNTCLLRL